MGPKTASKDLMEWRSYSESAVVAGSLSGLQSLRFTAGSSGLIQLLLSPCSTHFHRMYYQALYLDS